MAGTVRINAWSANKKTLLAPIFNVFVFSRTLFVTYAISILLFWGISSFLTWQRILDWAQEHYRCRTFSKDERIPARPGLLYLVQRGAIRMVGTAQVSATASQPPLDASTEHQKKLFWVLWVPVSPWNCCSVTIYTPVLRPRRPNSSALDVLARSRQLASLPPGSYGRF